MKKSNSLLKFFKIAGITFAVLLVILISLPFLFKNKIIEKVKGVINESIDATVEFNDVSISFIRSFPDVYFSLSDLKIIGKGEFEEIELASIDNLRMKFDLVKIIKNTSDLELKSLAVNGADLQVLVTPEGKANYDIFIPTEETNTPEETASFHLNLNDYSIRNTNIHYIDMQGNMSLLVRQLNHNGNGTYDGNRANFTTSTVIDSLSFVYDDIPYLSNATISQEGGLNIQLDSFVFTFVEQLIRINAMPIDVHGFVQYNENEIGMDIQMGNRGDDFSQIMSLIPGIYSEDFKDIQSSGQLEFKADVNGVYNAEKNEYPLFDIMLNIDNGLFKYTAMPEKLEQVYAKINIKNPTNDLNELTVSGQPFNFVLAGEKIESDFHLSNVFRNVKVNLNAKGGLNLEKIALFYPFDDINNLRGRLGIDGKFNFTLDDAMNGKYENISAIGKASIDNFNVDYSSYPTVTLNETTIDFSPSEINIPQTFITVGKTDISGNVKIKDYLSFLGTKGKVTGSFNTQSKVIDLNELQSLVSTEEDVTSNSAPVSDEVPFDRFNLQINSKVDEIMYTGFSIKDLNINGIINPERITINALGININDNTMNMKGYLNNIYGYLFSNQSIDGKIDFNSPFINLDAFYTETDVTVAPDGPATEGSVIEIPKDISMTIDAKIGKITFGEIVMTNAVGEIIVRDGEMILDGLKSNAFGGAMEISGLYNTKDITKPKFEFNFDIKSFDFGSTFKSVNTFRALAPVGEYIKGRFSTNLVMSGNLTDNMYPDLKTLTAKGFIQTINAVLNSFEPLNALDKKLNTSLFRQIQLKDTKNWFSVENGKVEVTPFDFAFNEIDMNVAGNYSLAHEMDFKIKTAIPRKLLEKSNIGASLNTGINWLSDEAGKKGINIAQGDVILLDVNLGGNIKSPNVNIIPTGMKSTKDAVKETIKEETNKVVTNIKEDLNEKKDSLVSDVKKQVDSKIDDVTQKAKDEMDNRIKQLVDSSKLKINEDLKNDAKNTLKKINPFKKK